MDTDQIVDLGNTAEVILTNPMFNQICEQFEVSTVHKMISTKPSQDKEREEIYATLVGVREFFGFMQSFVQERNKLLKKADPAPPVDPFDDPAVHDIYREQD
jgi:hypothetical protein